MESKKDRKIEPLPERIFDGFGAIWDPPKRPKIDKNGRGTLMDSVFVLDCVGFLDLDPILIDFDRIWTPFGPPLDPFWVDSDPLLDAFWIDFRPNFDLWGQGPGGMCAAFE